MATPTSPTTVSVPERLIHPGGDPHRPALENRVARVWEAPRDTLSYRSGRIRDDTTLGWAVEALARTARPARVVDIGCAYGTWLLMLDARMDLDPAVRYVGLDLDDRGIAYGAAFAGSVQGYDNCEFRRLDIEDGLPFDDASCDLVVSADVIEHLPDVPAALREMARVTTPHGRILLSTPVRDSLFKRVATAADRLSGHRIGRAYYRGKGAELDEHGHPVMDVHAGHDHISEMTYAELAGFATTAGLVVERARPMTVMSGSAWFDGHPLLMAGILGLEALHEVLQRPTWGHGVCVELRRP